MLKNLESVIPNGVCEMTAKNVFQRLFRGWKKEERTHSKRKAQGVHREEKGEAG